jgi:hypothetical protein
MPCPAISRAALEFACDFDECEALTLQSKVTVERIDPNTLRLLTASQPGTGGR